MFLNIRGRLLIIIGLVFLLLGCGSKKSLIDQEREMYGKCVHPKTDSIVNSYTGDWKLLRIDSTQNFFVLELSRDSTRVLGISRKEDCIKNKVVLNHVYEFSFSCNISNKGNHSFMMLFPNYFFIGHPINTIIPIGENDETVVIPPREKYLVLKILSIRK